MTTSDIDFTTTFLQSLIPAAPWDTPELSRTPERFVHMIQELTQPEPFAFTTFESDIDEMVVIKDIQFSSLCAHHIIPFVGKCHIGYVPNGQVGGLSKFARCVREKAKGLWNQENLTRAILTEIGYNLEPLGVIVVMEAEHLCMTIRGVQAPGTRTTTSCVAGVFAMHDRTAKAEFFQLLRG